MNAIASFDPNAANHRRRSTLSPRRPSLQGRVAPAKRAIHPLLVGKFRACDALLRRMNRFSPLFDGAFGARRRHLDRIGETFDTLRDGAATVPPEKLALALTLYDVEDDVRLGVLDALAGEARGGVDEATLAVAADVAQATEKARSLALKVRERVGGDARMKSGYFKLAQFIVSTIVMLCLVSAQSGFGVERSNLYQALMGAMFGLTGSVAGSFVDISTRVGGGASWPRRLFQRVTRGTRRTIAAAVGQRPPHGAPVDGDLHFGPHLRGRGVRRRHVPVSRGAAHLPGVDGGPELRRVLPRGLRRRADAERARRVHG